MKWYQFFMLMSAVYIAPHFLPGAAVVAGGVCFVAAIAAFRRGD